MNYTGVVTSLSTVLSRCSILFAIVLYPLSAPAPNLFTVVDEHDTPGARLRKFREDLKLSTRKAMSLSEGAVSHGQISNIERGATPWSGVQFRTIEGLARAYGTTPSRIVEVATGISSEVRELPEPQVGKRSIPVYNLVSAGDGADGGEIIGYLEIDANKRGNRVGYLIEGDSMTPEIKPGGRVEVILQDHAQPGSVIVAYTAEHGMVCKVLQSTTPDGYCVLTSYNPAYPPLVVACDEIHIKGVVEEIRNPAPKPVDEHN